MMILFDLEIIGQQVLVQDRNAFGDRSLGVRTMIILVRRAGHKIILVLLVIIQTTCDTQVQTAHELVVQHEVVTQRITLVLFDIGIELGQQIFLHVAGTR